MSNPTIRTHNAETNEIVDWEMDAAKLAQWQAAKTQSETEATAEATIAAAKAAAQAKLAALGLTTDDLKALGLGGNE